MKALLLKIRSRLNSYHHSDLLELIDAELAKPCEPVAYQVWYGNERNFMTVIGLDAAKEMAEEHGTGEITPLYASPYIQQDAPYRPYDTLPRSSRFDVFIRAFWRRINAHKNDFDKELPEEIPVQFRASMETALLVFDKDNFHEQIMTEQKPCRFCDPSVGFVCEAHGQSQYEMLGILELPSAAHGDGELLPCPFCGGIPKFPDGNGTQYEIECECGMSISSVQISDLMTHEERADDQFIDYRYGEEYVERAKREAIHKWNIRRRTI